MNYIIGIDAGTTNVKAVLFDTMGHELSVKNLENEPIYIGDVEVEQNMNLLWDKVAVCIKSLSREIGRRRVGKECRSRWSPYH